MVEYVYMDPVINEIVMSSSNPTEEDITTYYTVPDGVSVNDIYISGGAVHYKPTKPSQISTWDSATNTWTTPSSAQADTIFSNGTYEVSGVTYTVNSSERRLTISAGTATRSSGHFLENKNFNGTSIVGPVGSTLFVYYNWTTGSILTTSSLQTLMSDVRFIIMGQFINGTTFKEAPLIDGQNVLSRSIGANQLVADEAIINGAQIERLSVGRINIATGAVTEEGVYSVWPSGQGIHWNKVVDNMHDIEPLPQSINFQVGQGDNAESRLIFHPEFYGSIEFVTINAPTVNGTIFADFYCAFRLSKSDVEPGTGALINTQMIFEKSSMLNKMIWKDQRLVESLGGDSATGLITSMSVGLNEHYSAGQVLTMEFGYSSYSSNPAAASIVRRIPGYGYKWEAYWK